MIIWLAVILPLLLAGVLYVGWNHKITWWELCIQLVVPIILIACAKGCIETSQTQAMEYWGYSMSAAEYYEHWNEKVSCRHPISCSHPEYSTDSNGKRYQSGWQHSNDGYYHAYDVDEHEAYWQGICSSGKTLSIDQNTYNRLVGQFGNNTWVNLHRKFHTRNGNKYVARWQGEWDRCEPVTEDHSYENRVQASSSVFKFAEVNPKDFDLFEHPRIVGYTQRCVLGNPGPSTVQGEKKLAYLNATLGSSRQVRLYVLVFKNQPLQAGINQETYWKGGNKNEFVTCVGVNDSYEVQWSYVFSWSEIEILKAEAKQKIIDQKQLDLVAYADWLSEAIPAKWQRKNFHDFDYLTVDPPLSSVVWTFVLTLLVSIGLGLWVILNPLDTGRERLDYSSVTKLFVGKGKEGRP